MGARVWQGHLMVDKGQWDGVWVHFRTCCLEMNLDRSSLDLKRLSGWCVQISGVAILEESKLSGTVLAGDTKIL